MHITDLVGKIILAEFLEYSVERFIAFVSDIESSPLYRKLVQDGAVMPESFAGVVRQMDYDALKKSGAIVRVEGTDTDSFHLCYTAREFSTEYHINDAKLRDCLNSTKLAEERKNITLLLNKVRRVNTRNLLVHRILEAIVEQQKDYFASDDEIDLKPLSRARLAGLISDSNNGSQRLDFVIDTSRISRVLRKLFLITPGEKEVPLAFFFVSKKDLVKRSMIAVLKREKKDIGSGQATKAYADEELSHTIKEEYGLSVTRREVAYCRKEMGILPRPERNGYVYHILSANYSQVYPLTAASVEDNAPASPGVYELCVVGAGIEYPEGCCQTFYIGSAKNLRKRLLSHLSSNGKNGGIRQVIKERACVFRYLRVARRWDHEEKRFYDLFVSTYGGSPQYNYMSPKVCKNTDGLRLFYRLSQAKEVTTMAERDYIEAEKELEKERKLLRNVMATMPDSLLILDRTLLIKNVNRSFYNLFQIRPEEVIGRKITDMLGDEDGKLSAKLAALLGTNDKVENLELLYHSDKLGERTLNITARGIIVAEEEEEEEEELVVIRDITEHRRAEEALRRTEENFRRSLEDSPLGIRIVNEDGETAYANRAMQDIYGYTAIGELKATPVEKRYTADSYAEHQVRKEKRQRGEYVPSNYEINIVRKGGEIRHLEVFRKEVLWNGQTQFQVLYNDVTERKQAEEALKKSEERLKATVMNAPIGIATSGVDRHFLSANDAFCGILGYTEAELQKMSFKDITHPEDMKESVVSVDDIDAGKISFFSLEKRYIRKDGKVIIGKAMVSAVRDHEGRPYLYIAELEDVTERKRAEQALRESETRYRSLFNNMLEGFAYCRMLFEDGHPQDFVYLEVNAKFGELTGLEDVAGKKVSEVIPGIRETNPELLDIYGRVALTGKPERFETYLPGLSMWFSVSVYCPQKEYFVAVFDVITQRKQAEVALRASEGRLRAFMQSATESFSIFDSRLNYVDINERASKRYGLTREQMIGRNVADIVPETKETGRYEKYLEVIKTGEPLFIADTPAPAVLGADRRLSIRAFKVGDGMGMISTDITERKQAEEEIKRLLDRESQAAREWQETFDAVADIVMLVSPHHEVLRINRIGCEATGKKPEQLVGKKCYEVIHGLGAPIEQCPCAEALKTKKSHTSELAERGRHYLLTAYPMFDEGGEIVAFAHIVKDITERKQAEEERLELERKAHNASRLASIGEMAAGIAHEINNPLTPILGFTELLMKRELPEDAKSDLKIIYDSTRRTADVTRRLLTFARQSKPMRVLCDINEVVESTLQLRAYHLKTNNIKVVSELDPELPRTMADAGQLQQVFLNLLMNAEYEMIQYHGGGNLLIKTEKMGNIVRVSVKDDGPGISGENMEKLFTPFFTTKEVGEGTGLGLSVCHGVVAEHNGSIYAESKVGKGATFVVELPIVRQQKEKETKPSQSDTVEAGEAVKGKILVVDDEPTIVQVLKRVLTDEGYEVRATGKAKEALRLIEGGKYACILLDIKLPDMSGIELYQHLNKTDKSSTQRIIFITGDVMGADTVEFFSLTRACYITKPFDIEQLKKEVKGKLTPGA